jgi:threonine/homoserine/homoserine lactone efflux protein
MDAALLTSILVPIAIIQIVGWATPGPNHLTIITASVTAGRRAGMMAAMGIATGALTWSVIAVSGIAVIFEIFPPMYIGLRLIGAVYLFHLGIGAFRSARSGGVFNLEPDESSPATTAPFRTAFLVMMTNPKAVLFFGSILTAFIPPDASPWLLLAIAAQIGLLGALLNAIAALFFSAPAVMRGFQASGFAMSLVFGVLFCGLGILVGYDVLKGLF